MTTEGHPLYLTVNHNLSFEEWAQLRSLRVARIRTFVIPKLDRDLQRLNDPEAATFVQEATQELEAICQTRFVSGDRPSPIPIFAVLEEDNGTRRYNLNDGGGEHSGTTLTAAQFLIEALCPEQGLDINDDLETLLQKAQAAEKLGYGDAYNMDKVSQPNHVQFSTILPGITIQFSFYPSGRHISLAWGVY